MEPLRTMPTLDQSERRLNDAIEKEPAVRKVVKKSARLADRITEEDRDKSMEVIREALGATNRIYNREKGAVDIYPDCKTRLAAATLLLAYDEGLPVKRSVVLTGDFKSADELIAGLKDSPEAQRMLKALSWQGVQLVHDGEVIDLPAKSMGQ